MNTTHLDPQRCRCHDTAPTTRQLVERLIARSEEALDHAQTAASHARTVTWSGSAAEHYRDTLSAAHAQAAGVREGLSATRRLAWG
ncbi:hypothetical protein G1C96_0520 [Bifidobacterium sp. DSM 109958]|uniref:Uncharacterized protein n=1 Tax=Bifidobacterium moraviense TaxID=2675323 RepID=A0A7Y0F0T0_9BIFI|nr:hypothetical protein [Bifidobacterium sp. DSM 109958]NMM99942.1 hypothetical protein [Bifidobacterium sp. DSM 109958]